MFRPGVIVCKNSADLTNMGLIEVGRGCCKLAKFEVEGCKKIDYNERNEDSGLVAP